jgi:hypothetical protein
VDDGAAEPEVEGGPGGGVDAHVAHGPADYHFSRPGVFKRLQQAGLSPRSQAQLGNEKTVKDA